MEGLFYWTVIFEEYLDHRNIFQINLIELIVLSFRMTVGAGFTEIIGLQRSLLSAHSCFSPLCPALGVNTKANARGRRESH